MRVVQVVPSIARRSSGPTYTVPRLCEQLIAQGVDVTLGTTDRPDEVTARDWVRACSRNKMLGNFRVSPGMHRWLERCVRADRPDVLHSNSLWQMPSYYCAKVASRSGVPHIVSPRGALIRAAFEAGSSIKRVCWSLWQHRALREAACVHATAQSEAEGIRALGFGQPIAVVPNGIDVPDSDCRVVARQRELLFLGRIHHTKGIDMLLRAWRVLQQDFPDWRLRIVGPDIGAYPDQMRRLVSELRAERVVFAGELLGDEREAAFSRASVFVLPTRNENFGMAVAEALSYGLPSIVSREAPWQGLHGHGCGWWIEFGVEPLVIAIREAMATPPHLLHEMGQRGRRWMQAAFSWEVIGKQMQDVYAWVAAGRPRGAVPSSVIPD